MLPKCVQMSGRSTCPCSVEGFLTSPWVPKCLEVLSQPGECSSLSTHHIYVVLVAEAAPILYQSVFACSWFSAPVYLLNSTVQWLETLTYTEACVL